MDLENSTVTYNNMTLTLGEAVAVPRWCELILCTFLLISAILAFGGNSLILLVETQNKFKTSTDWLVFFMSANDNLFAVFNIPIFTIYHLGYWHVIANDITCKLHYFLKAVTMLSSTLLLTTVAIDRFFKTCK